MFPLLRNRSRVTALVVLVAIGSASCVKQNQPGVGLVKVETSAVFGIDTKAKTPPAGFSVSDQFVGDNSLPPPSLPVQQLLSKIKPTAKAQEICPDALNTSYIKDPATPSIKGMPVEGAYTWKRLGAAKVVVTGATARATIQPFGLETRLVRRIVTQSDHQFTYEMLAPDPNNPGGVVITSFLVNNNPALVVDRSIGANTIGVVDVPGADVRLPPPQDQSGMFITKIEAQDSKGVRTFQFQPVRPMLIAPLDAGILRSGQTFNSVGIDMGTGDVLETNGTVSNVSTIDACGELVQGYAISLKQTYSRDFDPNNLQTQAQTYQSSNYTRTVDYAFATQYGTLPVAESLTIGDVSTAAPGTKFAGKWTIGGLTPKPLPAASK